MVFIQQVKCHRMGDSKLLFFCHQHMHSPLLICPVLAELNSPSLVCCINHSQKLLLSLKHSCCHCQVGSLINLHTSSLFFFHWTSLCHSCSNSVLCALNSWGKDDRRSGKLDDLLWCPFFARNYLASPTISLITCQFSLLLYSHCISENEVHYLYS